MQQLRLFPKNACPRKNWETLERFRKLVGKQKNYENDGDDDDDMKGLYPALLSDK